MLRPGHHHHRALAHRLFVERQAGGVVGDGVDALFGQRRDLGGRLDIDPGHLALVDVVRLGEGRPHLALAVSGRRADRHPLEVLRIGDGLFLAREDVERRLVEDHPDDLDGRSARPRGDHHGAVGQARVRTAGVDLGDGVARPLGVLERDVEPGIGEVALVECDPIGCMVADREPVQRKLELFLCERRRRDKAGNGHGGEKSFQHVDTPIVIELQASRF